MDDSEFKHFTMPLSGGAPLTQVAPFQLNKSSMDEILSIVKKTRDDPRAIKFINMIAHCIAHFLTLKELEGQGTLRPERRKQLKRIKASSEKLLDAFTQMDPSVIQDLDIALQATNPSQESANEPWNPENKPYFRLGVTHPASGHTQVRIEQLRQELQCVLDSISFLENERYPLAKKGRPTEYLRLGLAIGIARAFKEALKIMPTTTQDTGSGNAGAYIQVLAVALIAAGVHIEDHHKLTCEAIKRL